MEFTQFKLCRPECLVTKAVRWDLDIDIDEGDAHDDGGNNGEEDDEDEDQKGNQTPKVLTWDQDWLQETPQSFDFDVGNAKPIA